MFVERLSQIDVERKFLPPIHQTMGFNKTRKGGVDSILFMYKDLMTSSKHNIFITDFEVDGVEDRDYLRYMYGIFGNEYTIAYLQHVKNKIFG